MQTDDVIAWTATETAARVRAREVTAVEVAIAHLDHLALVNPSINAVTRHRPDAAMVEAEAVDSILATGGDPGPLAGVPTTIKDNVDVAGESTPNGLTHLNHRLAPDDNPAVDALRAAGAVVIGRTNTPEFSWRWHTDNPLFGPTANPVAPGRTPGGSSGGAAAALAAGIGCLALGNDAGGSVRWPATCTGTAAIRPTVGRVASHNATAPGERPLGIDLLATQGPMARSIDDVDLMLEVLARPSWRDPGHVPAPIASETTRRVGIHRGAGALLHPDIGTAIERAAAAMAESGWAVEQVEVPDLEQAASAWAALINTDFHTTSRAAMVEHGSGAIHRMLDTFDVVGPPLDMAGLYQTLGLRSSLLRQWQRLLTEQVDAMILPVAMEPAWPVADDVASPARCEEIFAANTPLVAINLLGLPSVAVATGEVDGRPIGVQVVARRFAERAALAAARAIEDRYPPSPVRRGRSTPVVPSR